MLERVGRWMRRCYWYVEKRAFKLGVFDCAAIRTLRATWPRRFFYDPPLQLYAIFLSFAHQKDRLFQIQFEVALQKLSGNDAEGKAQPGKELSQPKPIEAYSHAFDITLLDYRTYKIPRWFMTQVHKHQPKALSREAFHWVLRCFVSGPEACISPPQSRPFSLRTCSHARGRTPAVRL
jgi:hypothetical protein